MVRGVFVAFLLTLSQIVWAQQAITLSPQGLEGAMTFQAKVLLPSSIQNTPANVNTLINLQIKHLLSILEMPEFAKLNGIRPNLDLGFMGLGNLEAYRIENESKTLDGTEITYRARTRVIMMKRVLAPGEKRTLTLLLPHDPVEIYARPCTDKEYYEKEYFFYYWNPFNPDCRVRLTGKNQVDTVTAEVVGLNPPPSEASPDYNALSRQIRARGELHISLLFGFDLTHSNPRDEGWESYNYFLKYFAKEGFTTDRRRNTPTGPYVELIRQGDDGRPTVHVSMSLSASDVNSPIVFARRAREAFETSDIVMYIGHSGLGGNLDLNMLTKLSSPDPDHPTPIRFPNAYQILFLDSCASYYFYSQDYALARKGIHHADIISNGTASYFLSQNDEVANFVNAFANPKGALTWLQVLNRIEIASKGYTYLVNVTPLR